MKKIILILLLCASIGASAQQRRRGPQPPEITPTWADLDYVGDSLTGHKLDIFLPANPVGKAKVIVVIYGSGWRSDNAKGTGFNVVGKALLNSGFAVVSINHRSSGEAHYPAQIHDVKAAIRYIRAHAGQYGLDTSFIGITGYSSGGHLSSLCAATNGVRFARSGDVEINIEGDLGNYPDYSSRVDACVDWYGPLDMSTMADNCSGFKPERSPEGQLLGGNPADMADMCNLMNPAYFLDAQDPDFLVIHGDADKTVSVCQSINFAQKLKMYDKLYDLVIVPDGGHGPKTMNKDTFTRMIEFFKQKAAK